MKVIPTAIPDVRIIEPDVYGDDRGFFMETWNARRFAEAGIHDHFVQDNHSHSARGVLRGLHYQLGRPQGKLVRVVAGSAFDVAVDLRRGSATFGAWVGVELSAANKRMIWIPPGFAHGFLSLQDGTDFLYKCTAAYAPEDERTVRWNDPELAIRWPLGALTPILSEKDDNGSLLSDAETYA